MERNAWPNQWRGDSTGQVYGEISSPLCKIVMNVVTTNHRHRNTWVSCGHMMIIVYKNFNHRCGLFRRLRPPLASLGLPSPPSSSCRRQYGQDGPGEQRQRASAHLRRKARVTPALQARPPVICMGRPGRMTTKSHFHSGMNGSDSLTGLC